MKKQKYHGNRHKDSSIGRAAEAYKRNYDLKLSIGLQMCADAAAITASEVCGMPQEQAAEFLNRFCDCVNAIGELFSTDGKDDADLVYSTATLDKAVRQAVGDENFTDYEHRYGFKK